MIPLTGTPVQFDAILRLSARVGAVVVGALAFVVLVWLGQPWWAPVPCVALLAALEAVLWGRGDRPVVLDLEVDRLVVDDRKTGRRIALRLDEVHSATLHVLDGDHEGRREAIVVLTDLHRVRFAARFLVEPSLPLRPEDIRRDAIDELLLGGTGGLKALAPVDAYCRQVIDDPAGQAVRWLQQRLPAAAWQRTAVRVWVGTDPPLDAFGLHTAEPDGLLVLDGDTWRLHHGDRSTAGTVTLVQAARATRTVELVEPEADDHGDVHTQRVDLALLVLALDEGLTLAFPAPRVAESAAQVREPEPDWVHCHVPEGAAVLWHLLTRWPESAWPALLREAARTVTAELPRAGTPAAPPTVRRRSPTRNR